MATMTIRDVPARSLARTHKLSIYDALFLTLAQQHSGRLYTADEKLAVVARKIGF